MNEVTIDEGRLNAEIEAAMVEAPVGPMPGDQVAPVAESWGPMVEGVVPMLRNTMFSQWIMPDVQQVELKTSMTQCLDQAFPGGMEGKYACWVRLLLCCAGIGFVNYSANGGQLPPLGMKKALEKNDEKAASGQN